MGTTRFVGRTSEFAAFRAALEQSERSVVLVTGEAGIGKTELIERVLEQCELGADALVVWVRCWDGSGAPPLWPWEQAMSQLAVETDVEAASFDARSHADDARFAQFASAADVLRAAGAARPTVIVLDDIHWADPASVLLARFVARDPSLRGVHLVMSSRPIELLGPADRAPHAALHREATHEFALGRLSATSIAELVGDASPSMLEHITATSEGNPFFALEMARALRTEGALAGSRPERPVLTPGIHEVIRDRLAPVGEEVVEVLIVAAHLGVDFDHDVVIAAAKVDASDYRARLAAATRAGLIRSDGHRGSFSHVLIAEALVAMQGPDVAAKVHLRLADALVATAEASGRSQVGVIAEHLRAAGDLVPSHRLARAAQDAAAAARSRFGWEDEWHFLDVAERALRARDLPDDGDLVANLIAQMRVAVRLGELDDARRLGADAAAVARTLDDPEVLASVAIAYPPEHGTIQIGRASDPVQLSLRVEALGELDGDNGATAARLRAALALALYWDTPTSDRAESHRSTASRRDELTRAAITTARRLDDDDLLLYSLAARIYANWGTLPPDERLGLAAEMESLSERLDDPAQMLHARVWRILDLLERGRIDQAAALIDTFEATARRIGHRGHLATVRRWRITIAVLCGDLDRAVELAHEAFAADGELMPPDRAFIFFGSATAPVLYLRCELAATIEVLEAMIASNPLVPANRVGMATASVEVGDLDRAREEIGTMCADDFALLPRDLNFIPTLTCLSLAARASRAVEIGRSIYRELEPFAGRLSMTGTGWASFGAIDLSLAQAADAAGDVDTAHGHYEAAITLLDGVGSPFAHVARAQLAELLADAQPERSDELLMTAAGGFESFGLATRARQAVEARAAIESANSVGLFERRGNWWLTRRGVETPLRNLSGFRALQELLRRPGEDVDAVDLVAVVERVTPVPAATAHEVVDDEAMRSYARRVEEIREELDIADRRGDVRRSSELSLELDALESELRQVQWHGRPRVVDANGERARVSMRKSLLRAIEAVGVVDGVLGRHLDESISTGRTCRYTPTGRGVRWSFVVPPEE